MMQKFMTAVFAFSLFVALSFGAARAATIPERSEGSINAPVVVEEFASLTCSHCAEFFAKDFPEIQERYIKTGKVRFIFRDFPLDALSLQAAALARCMPAEQYFPFIGVLYKNLAAWALSSKPEVTLIQYAKLGGLSDEKAETCIKDASWLEAITAERTDAVEKYKVQATPTFIFNGDRERIVGAASLKDFGAVVDKLLAAPKKQ